MTRALSNHASPTAVAVGLAIALGLAGWPGGPASADDDPIGRLIGELDSVPPTPDPQAPSGLPAPATPVAQPILGPQAEQSLLTAIEAYQAIRATGAWPVVPPGTLLAPGDRSARVSLIRQRLVGDATDPLADGRPGELFDGDLAQRVRRFQHRHGIEPDGIVGPATLAAMNVPIGTRLAQLRANLERIRRARTWIGPSRHVLVSLSAFQLQAIADGRVAVQSRVIVGRPDRPTPELRASIIAVDFLPTWHVPPGIARNDLFPRLRTDPGYFARQRITITRLSDGREIDPWRTPLDGLTPETVRFRQAAGAGNALGLIRLNMPNEHIVYLHDTADRSRYASSSRAFSSGCVRVEQIVALASWVLDEPDQWSTAAIEDTLTRGRPFTVVLPRSIPVHFVNLTAWAEGGGVAHFRPDLYGIDRHLGGQIQPAGPAAPEPVVTP